MGFEEPQAVYKWESGKSLPSLDNLVALAGLYQISLDGIIVTREIGTRERDDESLSFFARISREVSNLLIQAYVNCIELPVDMQVLKDVLVLP